MKFTTCFVVAAFSCITLFSQPNASQLIGRLKNAKNDKEMTLAYSAIFRYYLYDKPDSASYYLNQGMQYFTDRNNKYGIAHMTDLLATEEMSHSRLPEAKETEKEALAMMQELNDTDGIATAYNELGIIEGRTGNYDSATRCFLKALQGFEGESNIAGIQSVYLKLGVVNDQFNNRAKALEFYNKALELAKKSPDSSGSVYIYNNIGIVYGKEGDFNRALNYFDTALSKSNRPEYAGVRILTLSNMGVAYDNMNKSPEALKYLNEALDIAKTRNLPEEYTRISINIAAILSKTDPGKAQAIFKDALKTTKQMGQKSMEIDILGQLVDFYQHTKDYKEAFNALQQQKDLQDSMFSVEKAKDIANLQSVYDLEKSKAKVKELQLSDQQNRQQKNVIIFIAIGIACALVALAFSYRKVSKLNEQLSKREAELQQANTVKDKMFSIIGHDLRGPIANIPTVLEMYQDKDVTEDEKRFLLDSLTEHSIASLETLDKLLYWGQSQIKGIGLNSTVFKASDNAENVVRLLRSAADNKRITVRNNVPSDTIVYADPVHFDFVIRNLLSNAIKFTPENGCVEVSAENNGEPGRIIFSVKDNGIGMNATQRAHVFEAFNSSTPGTNNEKGTGIGLMLCKEFVTENGGRIWLESEEGKGTTFYFSLKKASV